MSQPGFWVSLVLRLVTISTGESKIRSVEFLPPHLDVCIIAGEGYSPIVDRTAPVNFWSALCIPLSEAANHMFKGMLVTSVWAG